MIQNKWSFCISNFRKFFSSFYKPNLIVVSILFNQVYAQSYCDDERFTNENYFNTGEIEYINSISYGLASFWYNDEESPVMNTFDIAFPKDEVDPFAKRPVIILAHGGGFISGDKSNLSDYIKHLAQRGFVAVSINYRVGWDAGTEPELCTGDPNSLNEAVYFATADALAAIRFIVDQADIFQIDTSQIFVGGLSAGAHAMLNAVYCKQSDFDILHPEFEDSFGRLDESTNTIDVDYKIKGVLNMWGAVLSLNAINSGDNYPMISFFGADDKIIPLYTGPIYGCSDAGYDNISGSVDISDKLNYLGFCYQTHRNDKTGHDAFEEQYVVQALSCFIKKQFCEECDLGYLIYETADCIPTYISTIEPIEFQSITNFLIYPNPSKDLISIALDIDLNLLYGAEIYNAAGIKMMDCSLHKLQQQNQIEIASLPSGLYYLKLQFEQTYMIQSFVSEK